MTSPGLQPEPSQIAGMIGLDAVMRSLAQARRVFHSEADLQFAFAGVLSDLAPAVRCRLEVPRARDGHRNEYLDLLCVGEESSTSIEFKYFTRPWVGEEHGEQYHLRAHAATDLARFHFIHDIVRLERMCVDTGTTGLAIMVTNEPRLWAAPVGRRTNDWAFRIHEGAHLAGVLEWGNDYAANRRELNGKYEARWQDFSLLDGKPGGRLRWLALPVQPSVTGST